MSELPQGWAFASLNELQAQGGIFADGDWIESKDQDPNGRNRLLQLADIGDGRFIDKSSRYVNDETFDRLNCTALEEGDILLARMPDPLGRACLMPRLPQRCLTVVDVAVFRSGSRDISHSWLMHTLNASPIREEISRNASGTTRKRIARGKLAELKVPVPPAAEQKRIAQKLDALLAQVDTLKARIDAIPALLKRFRQSVINHGVSGSLALDQHASFDTTTWRNMRAEDVCTKVQSGGTPKEGFTTEGIPFLKVYNIVDGIIEFEYRPQYIAADIHQGSCRKSITIPGDVLMNIVGPPLGKIAVVPQGVDEWNINQAITLFRPSESISSAWIHLVLLEGTNIRRVSQETKGSAGQVNISLSQCRDFVFPVPPTQIQDEIVRRVEQLFAYADQLEAKVAAAKQRIDALTQSLLAKAFRGELVPQDPTDEPASALLERIRAQRAAAPKPKRGRKAATS